MANHHEADSSDLDWHQGQGGVDRPRVLIACSADELSQAIISALVSDRFAKEADRRTQSDPARGLKGVA